MDNIISESNESLQKFYSDGELNKESLAKSYLEVESKLSSVTQGYEDRLAEAIELPGEDADDNTQRAFFTKLGCPEKPENYSEVKVEGVPEAFKQDKETLDFIKQACHKLGVSDSQYKGVIEQIMKRQLVSLDNFVKMDEAAEKETIEVLAKEWGGEDKFKERVELGKRLINKYDSDNSIVEFLENTRLGSFAPLVKLLGNIAADVMSEETTVAGDTTKKNKEAEVEISPTTGEPLLRYDKSPELMKK